MYNFQKEAVDKINFCSPNQPAATVNPNPVVTTVRTTTTSTPPPVTEKGNSGIKGEMTIFFSIKIYGLFEVPD